MQSVLSPSFVPETQIVRPGVGIAGRPVPATANAYKIKVPELIIHHYDIRILPPSEKDLNKTLPPALCRKVFAILKAQDVFGNVVAVFDGKRNIYTPKKLDYPQDTKILEVDVPEDDEDVEAPPLIVSQTAAAPPAGGGGRGRGGDRGGAPRGRGRGGPPMASGPIQTFTPPPPPRAAPGTAPRPVRTRKFKIEIRKVGTANVTALTEFVNKRSAPPADGQVLLVINALNVLCNHDVIMNYVSKKGNKFFPPPRVLNEDMIQLSQGLDIWRGYFSSIRMAPGGLLLNFDITSQVMIRPGNLIGKLMELLGKRDPKELAQLGNQRLTAERALKTLTIAAKLAGGRTVMKKKALALSKEGADTLKFELEDGKSTTVAAYFLKTHNYRLHYPTLPCVRLSQKAWYPLEVCHVASGQTYNRKLGPDQLASAIKWLTVRPLDRMRMLEQGLRTNFTPNPNKPTAMTAWGLAIEKPQAMQVRARVLEPPKLLLKAPLVPKDGSWDMRSKTVFLAAPRITTWIVLVFRKPNDFFGERDLDISIKGFADGIRNSGLQIDPPKLRVWLGKDKRDVNPQGSLEKFLRDNCPQQKPQLVLCYFDDRNAWQYAEIKRLGDVMDGFASQGLAIQKVKRGNEQYYGNVALKVNAKLGGINQKISPAVLGFRPNGLTMILGADVAHPGPGSNRPSVAAVVGSMNDCGGAYVPEFRVQQARVEMIVKLGDMMKSLILRFKTENKQLPARLIFYRDGVSEGQFAIVLQDEIPQIRLTCREIDPKWQPCLTFIVCGKRHHYRFGAVNPADADRSGNLLPGAVIDTDVVHPYDFDWYCQSHAGLLGTSRSSHYTVLVDDSQFKADEIQKLTYYLCYVYARSTRSVSIVTPAYYAHHVCSRVIVWLADSDDDSSTVVTGSSDTREEQLRQVLDSWTTRQDEWRKTMSTKGRVFSGEFWM